MTSGRNDRWLSQRPRLVGIPLGISVEKTLGDGEETDIKEEMNAGGGTSGWRSWLLSTGHALYAAVGLSPASTMGGDKSDGPIRQSSL